MMGQLHGMPPQQQHHHHQLTGYNHGPPPPQPQQQQLHQRRHEQQQQHPEKQQQQLSNNDFGNPPILNTSELIAGMSLTNIDVNTADLENLSSNLGTNLKLERHGNKTGGGGSSSAHKNNQ